MPSQDQGISPLFDDRAEEAIQYSPGLLAQLPKHEERPDRVWGLRDTKRFARLLQSNQNIRSSLARAADKDGDWNAGPLVWFLAYKDEQWRVQAAYVDEQNGKISYARDIYREGIARSLYKLAASDSTSLVQDEDIFSFAGNVADWISANPDTRESGRRPAYEDPLHDFYCKDGVVRDARFICKQLVGIMITAENLDEFLGSGKTDTETRQLTASLLDSIEDSFQVKGSVLNELELSWTGFDKSLPEMPHPEETFLVVVTSRFYLNNHWGQVRELTYVAVCSHGHIAGRIWRLVGEVSEG
ncbi:uncharacterized protein BKA55DRAFT_531742 [Fusarium redolens]|uniref:Uncharacterized protein n=1 Tax=Fusarium redolens TaxID=48865 RepID=A0A9P9KVD0_FUSRE|nr:uncharacterized protein BKA55DRAFT_531742 [Fusarium redolens]KAH7269073.1 hypothetical protein BKA55DRAFT_531742 [Fusarium redolens]